MFQLGSGIVGSELPVNALLGGVSGRSPGNKQTAESRQVGDSVVRNTLTPKGREFNFRNVKPEIYDIVEPYQSLYCVSDNLNRIRNIYADISEIGENVQYDRIITIAAFEHICNLPEVVERCKSLLLPGGCLRVAVPNEGRFLWKFAYKMTTGLEFQLKYGLDYSVLMDYEHINTADEIEAILMNYFPSVKMLLLGFNKDFAFYRYYECRK